jgi:IgGFc binding protein
MKHFSWITVASLAVPAVPIALVTLASCSSETDRNFGVDAGYTFSPDGGDSGEASVGCAGTRCSRDLHQVIDNCDGHIVTTCGEGTACGAEGACVPACTAAANTRGSLGCEFLALPPDSTNGGTGGSCFAAFIGNTWDEPVNLSLEYDNQEQDIAGSTYLPVLNVDKITYEKLSGPLPPGKVAVVFLSQSATAGPVWNPSDSKFIKCPAGTKPVLAFDPIVHGTTVTKSFRIKSDRPVSAYTIWPYGGALSYVSTATMLYPTYSLGSNYVLVDAWLQSMVGMPGVQIVADVDDTQVQLTPLVNLPAGNGVAGATAGDTATYTLHRGQTLQFLSPREINGSALVASHPVAVYGGSECMNIPIAGAGACDAAQQQLPPVTQWGKEYVGVRYRSRLGEAASDSESVPWRVVAAVDGTVLSYDPGPPDGAPTSLNHGETATFWSAKPFTIRSQDDAHPIYMSAYMTGGSTIVTEMGDPEFVNVVPSGQYLDKYVFFADVNYAETSLTFIRQKTDGSFRDVELDCAGTLTGWQPVGKEGQFEYTRVDLSRGAVPVTVNGKSCFIGPHEAHSDGAFSITVWGWDRYVSYAYPAGVGSRPLNQVTYLVK